MALLSELSTILAPYGAGDKVAVTGITIDGTDLADLFAPASQGAATAPITGILVNDADLATLFAAIGTTAKLKLEFTGNFVDYQYGSGEIIAQVDLIFNTDGTFSGGGRAGRWLAEGLSSSAYEIQIAFGTGDALASNTASTYQALSSAQSCSQVAVSTSGNVNKLSTATITIREIAAPTNKVEAVVSIAVTAESWGSSGFPP